MSLGESFDKIKIIEKNICQRTSQSWTESLRLQVNRLAAGYTCTQSCDDVLEPTEHMAK